MATWWERVEEALRNLGGQARLSDIYSEVRELRLANNETVVKSLEEVVRKELEYNSSDSSNWREGRDLFYSVDGIGAGVWGLREMLVRTPVAEDFQEPDLPERSETTTYRILRDTYLARKLKQLHDNRCQLCGLTICLNNRASYSEAHHIKPLGAPHSGPDVAENILVVCPNHHVMLDYDTMLLTATEIRSVAGHSVSDLYIEYHNERIVPG